MRAAPDFNATYPFSTLPAAGWGKDNTTGEWIINHIPSQQFVVLKDDGKDYTLTGDIVEATRFADGSDAVIASAKLKREQDVVVTD